MTANQRRPGFRLPWSPETGGPLAESDSSATVTNPAGSVANSVESVTKPEEAEAAPAPSAASGAGDGSAASASPAQTTEAEQAKADDEPVPAATAESGGDEFMRDLVAAMRGVADEARQTTVAELHSHADERVRSLETDAEARREALRARAEADVAGVADWAKAESERIKAEAEARVVARRAQLEQQIGAETAKTEGETNAVRGRVAEYERELGAYYAQLAEINDPAAFAAAAKRMPRPPTLTNASAASAAAVASPASPAPTVAPEEEASVEPATGGSNGVPAGPAVHPAEEEVLTARLAELDATLAGDGAAVATAAEQITTEIVVKGLGSFGAITGFRQSLSGVDGIEGVALSLGQTGEFVFRATHPAGFDVRSAITTLEGEGAKVEDRPEGGLRVTLDRGR
ncbi:MAG: hypothetical protein H0W98_04120 [Chloroflexi bacterium]|nr:hypothetical protein [Chloroflexota bacterium]